MFFQNIWTNWKTGIRNVGRWLNDKIPAIVTGGKWISKSFEGLPVVGQYANMATKGLEFIEDIHRFINKKPIGQRNEYGEYDDPPEVEVQ